MQQEKVTRTRARARTHTHTHLFIEAAGDVEYVTYACRPSGSTQFRIVSAARRGARETESQRDRETEKRQRRDREETEKRQGDRERERDQHGQLNTRVKSKMTLNQFVPSSLPASRSL